MTKLNLLNEGFVFNVPVSGGRPVNPQEMDNLLSLTGSQSVTTVSGDIVNLSIDLGFMHSVEKLRYKTTPLTTSGLSISYGREQSNLTSGTLNIVGSEIVVEPTTSGFTYPRYFTLTHQIAQSGVYLDYLIVENTEEEIDFGTNGSLNNVTLTSPITEGYSDVVEIPVLNSGTVTADIFVTVDTSRTTTDIFERLEISPTATGTFESLDPNKVPENIPWEWGAFQNVVVNNDNNLQIESPNISSVGSTWNPYIQNNGGSFFIRGTEAVDINGNRVLARLSLNNGSTSDARIQFIDPILRTYTLASPALPYTLSDTPTHLENQHLAYDSSDNVYWIRGSSTQTGGSPQELYKYTISTNTITLVDTLSTIYNGASKGLIYDPIRNNLHILAGHSTAQDRNTPGSLHVVYDLDSNTEVAKSSLPYVATTRMSFNLFEDYIYFTGGFGSNDVWRYNIALDSWSLLPNPGGPSIDASSINPSTRELWIEAGDDGGVCPGTENHAPTIRPLNLDNLTWGPTFVLQCAFFDSTISEPSELNVILDGSVVFFTNANNDYFAVEVIDEPPVTTSGYWLSPVFLVRQGVTTSGTGEDAVVISGLDSFHRVLIDRIENNTEMIADNSISVESYEIRTSSTSPAGDNSSENFTTSGIDTTRHVVGSVGGVFADQTEDIGLEFNHAGSSAISAAFVYTNEEFATTGEMQYRFWWRPPEQKSGSGDEEDRTSFYIVPFLDTLNTGAVPIRDGDTFRRSNGDYLAIRLGNESDTSTFTRISVFKGGGSGSGAPDAGTDNFSINASSDKYYEVVFNINWETGSYKLRFGGDQVGTGTIPLSSRLLLEQTHGVEIYSSSTGINTSFTEYFRYLTVNRVNLEARQDFSATPLHLEDPLYGLNGSLDFVPVTVNSSLFPVEDYIQVKLNFRGINVIDKELVSQVAFPPVIRLPNVAPGQYKSVYIRYNFPASNSLLQEQLYLKAYMVTDKED